MATRFSNTIVSDLSSNAKFQAQCQFIEDTLVTTGGWIVTADTGQTAIASLAFPTGSAQKKGYRIYKSNDGITPQIFMRLDYGSCLWSTSPFALGIWLTLGTGSDGAGNITGILVNGGSATNSSLASNGSSAVGNNNVTRCYGSAGPGRFTIAMFVDSSSLQTTIFSLERTKDSAGNDTGAGLLLAGTGGGSSSLPFNISLVNSFGHHTYVIATPGAQPGFEFGFTYILTRQNPSETFTPGDIGLGILIPFKGVAQQPGLNWLFCNLSDVSAEGFVTTNIYGAARTYQHLNVLKPAKTLTGANCVVDSSARCLMRYD